MKKILVTDDVAPILLSTLRQKGHYVNYRPSITLPEVHTEIGSYDGIFINTKVKTDAGLLGKAIKLQFIARLGSGLDIIDLPYAAQKGIAVFSAPEGNRNAVAEHALGMLLCLAHKLYPANDSVKKGAWEREGHRGFEIMGKTIGIIGFGNNGSAFGQKLAGLGVHVLAYDKYLDNYTRAYPHIEACTLSEIQEKADIISLHIPLTTETHHMVNHLFLDQCKQGVILINTARGANIATADLISALETGQVGHAALDVLENEKPHTYNSEEAVMYGKLKAMPQVLLSPHVAGWTVESKIKIATVLLDKLSEAGHL